MSTRSVLSALVLSGSAVLISCATPERGPTGAGGPGGGPPDYDPKIAFLARDEVVPDDPLPPTTATPPAEPTSERAMDLVRRGEDLRRQQRYTEATLELEKALRSDPNSPDVHSALALTQWTSGNSERARAHAQEAVAHRSDDAVARYVLGRLAAADRHLDEAVRQFGWALKSTGSDGRSELAAVAHFHLAQTLNAAGYLTAAVAEYEAFAVAAGRLGEEGAAGPTRELATIRLAHGPGAEGPISVIHEKLGHYDQAAEALERFLAHRQGRDAAAQARLAVLLAKAGRADDALQRARDLVAEDSSQAGLLTQIHEIAGQPRRVVDDLRQLTESKPDDASLLTAYVDALERFERAADAEAALRRYLDRNPADRTAGRRLIALQAGRGRHEDALKTLTDLLREDPNEAADARRQAAEWVADASAAGKLVSTAKSAPTADLDFASAYLLGVIAEAAGDTERAEELLRRSVDDRADFVPARAALGTLFLETFRWDDALRIAKGPMGEVTDYRIEWLAGEAWSALDDYDQAVTHYNEAIRLNRADTDSMYALGRLHERFGQPRRAQRQYQLTLEQHPLEHRVREALALLFVEAGERDPAVEQIEELERLAAPPTMIARCRVRLAATSRDADFALFRTTLKDAMAAGTPDPDTLQLLAQCYFAQRSDDPAQSWLTEARKCLDQALSLDPNHLPSLEMRVLLHGLALEFDKAGALLRDMLARYPNRRAWFDQMIDVLGFDQRWDEAVEFTRRAMERTAGGDEDRAAYRLKLVSLLEAAKRYDDALAELDQWRLVSPEEEMIKGLEVGLLESEGRRDDALAAARAWLEAAPGSLRARHTVADLLRRRKQYPACYQQLLDWISEDPTQDTPHLLMADALSIQGRHDDAVELVTNRLVASRDQGRYQELLLMIYGRAKRPDDAVQLLTQMINVESQSAPEQRTWDVDDLQRQLVAELVDAGRFNLAQAKLGRWVSDAESPQERSKYLRVLAMCHQRRGNLDQQIETLRQAHDLTPDDAEINNNYGYTLTDAGRQLAEAERMIRYAVANAPRSSAYLDSLGWVRYKQGDFEQAVEWLKKAAGGDAGDDPVIRDHLGDAYWRGGRTQEAIETWREAVRLAEEKLEDGPVAALEYHEVLDGARTKLRQAEQGSSPATAPVGSADVPADAATTRP